MEPVCKALCYSLDILSCAAQRTFPYDTNPPLICEQSFPDLAVVYLVSPDLFPPEVRVCSGPLEQRAVMSMPETSMYKYYSMVTWQHDIRFAGQVTGMQPKPEAASVQQAADQDFRSGIAPAYSGHHPATCSTVDYVSHQANNGSGSGVPSCS